MFRKLSMIACTLGFAAISIACQSPTLLVHPGQPVQLRKAVKADVWVFDARGERVPSTTIIPAGWWALSEDGDTSGTTQ